MTFSKVGRPRTCGLKLKVKEGGPKAVQEILPQQSTAAPAESYHLLSNTRFPYRLTNPSHVVINTCLNV